MFHLEIILENGAKIHRLIMSNPSQEKSPSLILAKIQKDVHIQTHVPPHRNFFSHHNEDTDIILVIQKHTPCIGLIKFYFCFIRMRILCLPFLRFVLFRTQSDFEFDLSFSCDKFSFMWQICWMRNLNVVMKTIFKLDLTNRAQLRNHHSIQVNLGICRKEF